MQGLSGEIRTLEVKATGEKSRVVVNRLYRPLLMAEGLLTFADFFHYADGELIKRIPDRTVTRIQLGDQGATFFLKRHLLEIRPPWQRQQPLLGRGGGEITDSEGAAEFDNYSLFRLRGLATAVPVAMGERQVEGGGIESFLLTLDFAPLLSLEDIIRYTPELLAGHEHTERRRQLLACAADYARRMHHGGLNHLDFNATHILLLGPGNAPYPLPPHGAVFDLQRVATNIMTSWRWPVKTLAELNFTLPPELFDDEDRLFMLRTYVAKERLGIQDRLLWRAVLAKSAKIARHTKKRRARRKLERERGRMEHQGPCHLLIHDQDGGGTEPVTVERVLRQVPGSREVWAGTWRSRPVIVKAFHGQRGARQVKREWQGLKGLLARGIVAPSPLLRGEDSLGRQVLVVEAVDQAISAAEHPALHTLGSEGDDLRYRLIYALAEQHLRGVEQRDLHPGNFLLQGTRLFAIDPAEMRFVGGPLGQGSSLAQLVAMGALFPELGAERFAALAQAYARLRQWNLSTKTMVRLERRRQEAIAVKIKKRLRKYGRANTRHQEVLSRNYRLLIDRQSGWLVDSPDELAAWLREVASALPSSATEEPFPFTWGGRQLAAYRIPPRGILFRLREALFPCQQKAIQLWRQLYRQEACSLPGQTPVGLLMPCSAWPGLSAFVIIDPKKTSSPQ